MAERVVPPQGALMALDPDGLRELHVAVCRVQPVRIAPGLVDKGTKRAPRSVVLLTAFHKRLVGWVAFVRRTFGPCP
jgi:hypothetical protein